jgi:NAD(P)H dehydrogenase (quinone)
MLTNDGHYGAIYNLTGPQALTGAERAAIAAEITGQPIAFQVVPENGLRAGMAGAGLPPFVVDVVIGIQSSFVSGHFNIVTGDVEKLSGKPARPLTVTLAAALGQ